MIMKIACYSLLLANLVFDMKIAIRIIEIVSN